jgi:lipopolysaccharide assembly protein A
MRVVYFLILLAFAGVVVLFAVQNHEDITVRFLDRSLAIPLSLLVAAVYILGMLSGWTVVGFLRRSWQRATEHRRD